MRADIIWPLEAIARSGSQPDLRSAKPLFILDILEVMGLTLDQIVAKVLRHRLSTLAKGTLGGRAGGASLVGVLLSLAIDLTLHLLGSLPARLLSHGDIVDGLSVLGLLGSVAAARVALDEERDEEIGERSEVEHVEPDGEGGVVAGNAGDNALAICGLGGVDASSIAEDKYLLAVNNSAGSLDSGSSLLGVGDNNGDSVRDEGVDDGVGGTEKELGDLHAGEGTLDGSRNADVEGSNGVVSVLGNCQRLFMLGKRY